jgi:alpha-methylacyl-CoA racemase
MPADASSARIGPLRDVRVLDLSRYYPGSFCTLLLADLGADVVKVEAPGGEPSRARASSTFLNEGLHRGKRSMTLNLKHPEAGDVLRRLVATADVLIESARPGAMDRMNVGYEQLSAVNPRLVWCSLTPFGDDSPYADQAAHELNLLGYSGLWHTLVPEPTLGSSPFGLSTSVGGLMAVVGVLSALRERDLSGVGSRIDSSIIDSAGWLLSDLVAGHAEGVTSLPRGIASISTYPCADGKMITVSATEASTWHALTDALDLPELRDRPPLSPDGNEDVSATLAKVFATRTSTEWLELLGPLRASVGPVNAIADLFDDPHVIARETIVERGGRQVLANPIRISGRDGALTQTAPGGYPEIGQDTAEVLAGAGYGDAEIEALSAAGVV